MSFWDQFMGNQEVPVSSEQPAQRPLDVPQPPDRKIESNAVQGQVDQMKRGRMRGLVVEAVSKIGPGGRQIILSGGAIVLGMLLGSMLLDHTALSGLANAADHFHGADGVDINLSGIDSVNPDLNLPFSEISETVQNQTVPDIGIEQPPVADGAASPVNPEIGSEGGENVFAGGTPADNGGSIELPGLHHDSPKGNFVYVGKESNPLGNWASGSGSDAKPLPGLENLNNSNKIDIGEIPQMNRIDADVADILTPQNNLEQAATAAPPIDEVVSGQPQEAEQNSFSGITADQNIAGVMEHFNIDKTPQDTAGRILGDSSVNPFGSENADKILGDPSGNPLGSKAADHMVGGTSDGNIDSATLANAAKGEAGVKDHFMPGSAQRHSEALQNSIFPPKKG
jgi:hypothetical protein